MRDAPSLHLDDDPIGASPPGIEDAILSRAACVLQVLPALATGGVERGTVDVAGAIAGAGGLPLVASSGGPLQREIERLGGRHLTLPLDRKTPWHVHGNARRLAELLQAENVDILHARSRAPAWSAWLAARRTGTPFVTTFHGTYGTETALKRWYNSVMTRGDRVIAISAFIAEHVGRIYGTEPGRIRVIPRGVDLAAFDPDRMTAERLTQLARAWRLPDGAPVVLLPGRLARWKGHAVLVEAMARLRERDAIALFVGPDGGAERHKRELVARIERAGLGGRVRFVGDCRDMPAAYMLADVVVSTSTKPEAFGRVTAEASAMGRPVVASNHGGSRETIRDGVTGWLTPVGDAGALADAIDRALTLSDADRRALAAAGRAHIAAGFSKTAMCQATLDVYDELL